MVLWAGFREGERTFVKIILILLTLLSSTSSRVQLVAETTKEAAVFLLLLSLLAGCSVILVSTSEVLDEIHYDDGLV